MIRFLIGSYFSEVVVVVLLIQNGLVLVFSTTKMLALLHCSFMENIFLVKIQTNVNQRKHIHTNFLSEVSHTIKIQNFDHHNWSDLFCIRTYFSLPG